MSSSFNRPPWAGSGPPPWAPWGNGWPTSTPTEDDASTPVQTSTVTVQQTVMTSSAGEGTATAENVASNEAHSTQLSHGAIAGIVVAVLLLLSTCLGVYFFIRKRRLRRETSESITSYTEGALEAAQTHRIRTPPRLSSMRRAALRTGRVKPMERGMDIRSPYSSSSGRTTEEVSTSRGRSYELSAGETYYGFSDTSSPEEPTYSSAPHTRQSSGRARELVSSPTQRRVVAIATSQRTDLPPPYTPRTPSSDQSPSAEEISPILESPCSMDEQKV